jgi:hypothetical protein
VFAYGFRNPFGGVWRAADGGHYEVENGPSVDRFAKVVQGRNYLWSGTDASMRNFALYNWEPSHAPVNIAMVEPQTFFGSGFPEAEMDRAFVTESGPTYATGPQSLGKRIAGFAPGAGSDFAGALPSPLIEYTGTGKATAAGLAAGPDGLYFTDLYKDTGFTSPIDRGANVLRVRYVQEPPGYARPAGATPLRVPLVPSYGPCGAPNRTHGPPLAASSCSPPLQTSDQLTVGTPDANTKPARSIGWAKLRATPGNPSTPADVLLEVSLTDVRRSSNLADYTGELEANLGIRLTDTHNGPALDLAGTTEDLVFRFVVPCAATSGSHDSGGACAVATTADALVPGVVLEGRRAIWQLDRVQVMDGGADGEAGTQPNTPFAAQGLFVP